MVKTSDQIIQAVVAEGRNALFEHEAKELVRSVGIVVPKYELAEPRDNAILTAAGKIGFPLALKAISPDILHKTEAGAVMLDIKNKIELSSAIKQTRRNIAERMPNAFIRFFLLEKMMPSGPEVLVGALRDEQFGPAIAFGMGGTWTEAFKDVVFGILPLTDAEMIDMINHSKASVFFAGFRGSSPLDRASILLVMSAVSRLMTEYNQIREIDLNPIRLYARGAAALDVRILLQQ